MTKLVSKFKALPTWARALMFFTLVAGVAWADVNFSTIKANVTHAATSVNAGFMQPAQVARLAGAAVPVRAMVTADSLTYNNGAGTLTGTLLTAAQLDNVSIAPGDDVLVSLNSTARASGGIYTVTTHGGGTTTFTRKTGFTTAASISGLAVRVLEGARHAGTWSAYRPVVTLGTSNAIWVNDRRDSRTYVSRIEDMASVDGIVSNKPINSTQNTAVNYGTQQFAYFLANVAGVSVTHDANDGADSSLHWLGVITLNPGTSPTGSISVVQGFTVLDTDVEYNYFADVVPPVISDGSVTWTTTMGAGGTANGLYFDITLGVFHGNCSASAVVTSVTGPAATAGTKYRTRILKPLGLDTAEFYVNDSLIGACTAGQFNTASKVRVALAHSKTLGALNRALLINRFGDSIFDPKA